MPKSTAESAGFQLHAGGGASGHGKSDAGAGAGSGAGDAPGAMGTTAGHGAVLSKGSSTSELYRGRRTPVAFPSAGGSLLEHALARPRAVASPLLRDVRR